MARIAAALLLLAAFADSLTFVLMGTANEANPIAAHSPLLALAAKALLATALFLWPWRYATPIRAFGAFAWTVGALSNGLVLLS